MEGLNIAIQEACEKSLFHDIRLPKSDSNLSHPFYTDDALFIGDWSQNNLKNLARILWCFHVFRIGVSDWKLACNARILGCDVGSFPFNYLGVLVGANMNLIKNWKLKV
uniref:Reverse transcriptase domain-containing protein n=1 Tax=Lactuca sativa TaxID=4236 RepID=A0A9R1UJ75_LACSA|nr:hypothetical protein LSAT_V11C900480730 [Lactuca sativa]